MKNTGSTVNWVLHICTRQAWNAAELEGEYRAVSLENEGFIHFSRPEQIIGTANLFFANTPDIVLLWIDPNRLQSPLRWEAVGEQVFPHLYGALNLAAVAQVNDYHPDADGVFRQPPVLFSA